MKNSELNNNNTLGEIKKVLRSYSQEMHMLKDTFLSLAKEMLSNVLRLQFIITDIASSYISLNSGVLKKDNLELVITPDDIIARANSHNVGCLNTTNEIAIMNCLFVIAGSQIYIRTLIHLFREYFEFSNRRRILNALEDTVRLSNSVLDKISL